MISISALTTSGRHTIAIWDPQRGFYYDGKVCSMDYVFQEMEMNGFMATIDVSYENMPDELPMVRKTATLRVTFIRD